MRHLKDFLDKEYPNLAFDWSGMGASNTYLKTAFQNWMRNQRKSNGEPYKSSTITAYSNALKNSTAKLNLSDITQTDLFYYTSIDDFEKVHKMITSAPNFNEVDLAAGNKAYSNGMILYGKFLKEMAEPSCWIFQGNPKYYDVVGAINDLETITWAVNQYPKQIKKGDKAYIWLSGSEGGIIAVGTIITNPELTEPVFNDRYSRGEALNTEPYLAVDINLELKLTNNVISRTVLLADERTKRLEILTYPGATNFRVTKEQDAVIKSIIDGSYERVPATTNTTNTVVDKKRYWIYAPGEGSRLWDEFYHKGIMGIAWEKLGDLRKYPSKETMKEKMKDLYGEEYSYKNAGHATWQFANELKTGDIVFVKKGLKKSLGGEL